MKAAQCEPSRWNGDWIRGLTT